MSSLNIEYNGASIPIADIGIVSSKQKVILGNLLRDLVLQTAGSISILVGNRYYDLSFSSNGLSNTITSNVNFINSILGTSFSNYENGAFVFASDSKSLYIIYNGQAILLAGDSNKMFLSFSEDQELTGDQKKQLLSNTESIVNSIDDVKKFTKNKVYDGYIIFVNDENQHYILSDINNPELKLSWSTFYIGPNGGIINNGLVIKNKTRENLLYLNGIDNYNSLIFNGLKIGDENSNIKISVTNDDISLLKTKSKHFKLYNNSNLILSSNNGNIGIGGISSGSDKYKILFTGNAKFDDYIYADNRILSSDYTSTNVTHWDGGKGFALIKDTSGNWFMEVDDLIVRNSLTANLITLKELKVERTYATGGHMIVTDGSIVDTMYLRKPTTEELNKANVINNGSFGTLDSDSYYYFVTFKNSKDKDDNNAYVSLDSNPQDKSINGSTVLDDVLNENSVCPFIYDDILLCLNVLGINAKRYYCKVSYSTNNYIAIKESDFRNNKIYQHDINGDPISVIKEYLIEKGDELVRITNISVDSEGKYKYDTRRRFIDIDGTRNLITMYDKMGNSNLFSVDNLVTTTNGFKYYPNINVVTGIKDGENQGALKLRMGRLDDLGINGLSGYGLYADNVYLKGKLIVKNDDIETFVGANRGTWLPDNTNTYYINDLVTFGGSVYRCITKHTTTLESKAPGASNFWEIFVKKGEDGIAGNLFRYVELSGELVFVFNNDTQSFEKNLIPLTCTAFNVDYKNITSLRFDWKIGESLIYSKTYQSSELSSTTISDSFDIYALGTNNGINWDNYWNGNKALTIRCLLFVDNSETYDSDTFSLYKIYSATPNYTWIKYSANSNGIPMQNDPSGMKYIGIASNLTDATEGEDPSVYTWSLIKGIDGSFVTFAYTASTLRPDKPTGTPANPGTPWVLNTPTVSDSAKYIWMSLVLTALDGFVGEWSLALRITGEDGVAGDDGKSIEFIFKLSNETSLPTPESVNSDGYVPDGWTDISSGISESYIYEYVSTRVKSGDTWSNFSTPSIWSKWGLKGLDGAGVEYIYARTNEKIISDLPAITNDPNSPEHIPDGWSDEPLGVTEVIKYEWVSMRKKPEGASLWGNFSTPAIWAKWGKDGGDSLTGVLTNDSANVISNSEGVVSDYSLATGFFITYFGTSPVTNYTSFSVLLLNNCIGTINTSTGEYSISSLTADSGTLVLQGIYTTVGGTEMTITKVFSISKTKTGADGSPAVMYSIEPTTYAISKSSTSIYSPSSVTFNFYKITGTLKESYSGYFKTSYYNGTSWNYLITNGNSNTTGNITPVSTYKIIRCELYSDSGYATLVDTQTVIIVLDGYNGAAAGAVLISGDLVFKYNKGATSPNNSTIILNAVTLNISGTIDYKWSYYNVYLQLWIALTESSSYLNSYTFNVSLMSYTEGSTLIDHNTIRIRCSANGYTDETTLIKIYDGSDSYNVILTNESHTIACNSAGAAKSGELGSSGKAITRIIVYKGLNLISYGTGGWSYGTITDSNVTHNISSDLLYIETISADSGYVDIPIVVNGITIVTKRFSLSKSKDGIDGDFGVLGMLTNDSVTLIADSSGVVSDFSNATGTFKMYYGSSDVTTLSTFQKDVEKSIGCVGTINASTGVYSVSGFSNGYNSGYLTLTGTYSGITITRVFSVSKAIAGISGTSPTVYSINPSANTIVKSNTGTYSPSSVVFNFYKTTGSGSPTSFNSGSAKVYISSDGNSFTTLDSKTSVSSITGTPNSSTKYIKCDLFSDKNYTTLVDSLTILVVSDGSPGNNGSDAYTAFFTNESINIPALNNGLIPSSVLSSYNFITKAIVYSGSNKAIYNATTGYGYTITLISGSPITTTISGPNSDGLAEIKVTAISLTLSNGSYTPISASTNFTIVIKKDNVTIATLTKTLYISASKQGESALALKWISDWDGLSTSVSSYGVATPRIFAGTKTGNNITGVMIGANVFGLTEIGIAGYYYNGTSNIKTFHLNAVDGSFLFGTGNSSIIYTPSTNSLTLGSNITMSWSNITGTNVVTDKLTKIDATGVYTGTLTASLVNAVAINASSITTGTLSADRINSDSLTIKKLSSTTDKYKERFSNIGSGLGIFRNLDDESSLYNAIVSFGDDLSIMSTQNNSLYKVPALMVRDARYRSEYNSSNVYFKDDRVYYNNGTSTSTYIFKHEWSDIDGNRPTSGILPTNTSYWSILGPGIIKGGYYFEAGSGGVFANGGDMAFLPASTGITTNASGAFLLFKDNNSSSGLSAAIIGIDSVALNPTSWNSSTTYDVDKIVYYNGSLYRCIVQNINKIPTNTTYWSDTLKSRTYGGYFVRLRADGWLPAVTSIYSNYTISKTNFRIHCYNYSGTITLTLPIPTNSDLGLMYEIRAMYASDVIVNAPNAYYPLWYEGSKTSHTIGDYDCIMLVWDGSYWVINTMGQ